MDYLSAINNRKSRRSYKDTPISNNKIEHLKELIEEYNKEGCLGIQIIEDGSNAFSGLRKSYGMFSGVRTLIALIGNTSDVNLREKLGYYGELLVLEATNLGLGTCWVGGSFDKKAPLCVLKDDEILVCVITIGNVVETESFKEKLIHKATHRKTKTKEEFYSADSEVPTWFVKGIEAVQKAPSAMNSQKVRFAYKEQNVTAYIEDTYTFDLVDLGIAKAHFSLIAEGYFDLGNPGKFIKK